MNETAMKLAALRQWMASCRSVLVAYSGGVDSSLVLKVAVEELGVRAGGLLAVSASLPASERREALELAEEMGAKVHQIETHETADERYQANGINRCYFCKSHVYEALTTKARELGHEVLLDGMNAEDTLDLRPGRAAAAELGVKSPLHELGFSKRQVREAARSLGLRNWDKPAAACLSSRIPYGTPVTSGRLSQVELAEESMKRLGFRELRVRHHGEVARLELPVHAMESALQMKSEIASALRQAGFVHVALDLEGLRSGSLNEPLRIRAGKTGSAKP